MNSEMSVSALHRAETAINNTHAIHQARPTMRCIARIVAATYRPPTLRASSRMAKAKKAVSQFLCHSTRLLRVKFVSAILLWITVLVRASAAETSDSYVTTQQRLERPPLKAADGPRLR